MQTPTRTVDIAIIGAGTAGQFAFKQARKTHANVVIIDNGLWTTTCTTVGCMPSKLLVAAAHRASIAQHSAQFGVTGDIHIDGKAVMIRVQRERDYFTQVILDKVNEWGDDEAIEGIASLMGKDDTGQLLIKVTHASGEQLIAAKSLIIATGSQPVVPEEWQGLGERVLTSDTIFELPDLPKRLAVIGAGAIGLELAQAMAKLGVAVTLLNRQHKIGGISDDVINELAIDILSNHATTPNLTFELGVAIDDLAVSQDGQHLTIRYHANQADNEQSEQSEQPQQTLTVDYVLLAIGRKTYLAELGIETMGVTLDKKGSPQQLDPVTGQIADTPIFVVGDASAVRPLMHVASEQGYNAGTLAGNLAGKLAGNLASQWVEKTPEQATDNNLATSAQHPQRVPLSITFTDPNIAQIGQTLSELTALQSQKKLDFVIGKASFFTQGRSRVMGVNAGQLNVYADKATGKILGAALIAPDGEYLAHLFALAIQNNLTVEQFLAMPFYHPTIVEGVRTALYEVKNQLA